VEKQLPKRVAILFSIEIQCRETYKKVKRELQVIKLEKLQVSLLRFWGSVPVEVWSARDHFIPLMM